MTKTKLIPHDGLDGPRRYLAVATISMGTIITAMDSSLVNIALPTITSEFHISAASSVLIVNASQIAMLVFLLPLAALGAQIGYRRIYLTGLVVFFTGSFLGSISHSLPSLVAARALQGMEIGRAHV